MWFILDGVTIVTINGTDYYVPSDYVDRLVVVDGYLINTGSSSVTLYHDFRDYNVNSSGYPRITCPSNTKAYITQSYNSGYSTLSINSYVVQTRSFSDVYLIGTVIIGILALLLFKKR